MGAYVSSYLCALSSSDFSGKCGRCWDGNQGRDPVFVDRFFIARLREVSTVYRGGCVGGVSARMPDLSVCATI